MYLSGKTNIVKINENKDIRTITFILGNKVWVIKTKNAKSIGK